MIRRPAVLPLALLLAAGGAAAQAPAPAAPPKHDSNAPLDWTADSIEVQDRAHRATLTGSVRVVQQEMTLTADRVTANYTGSIADGSATSGKTSPQVQRLDATGNVVVTRPNQVTRSDYGIYDLNQKLITMIGHVSVNGQKQTGQGGRMVINLASNEAKMYGGEAGSGGRVSGRFTVGSDSKTATPATDTAPKKP